MQWNAAPNGGFTGDAVKPWLPVPANVATINVDAEKADPNSLLAWHKSLIQLKKTNPAFAKGDTVMLDTENTKVLSWLRKTPGAPAVVVAANFTAEAQTVSLTVPEASGAVKTLLKSPGIADPVSLSHIELAPFGVFIGEVK
jgi:alpha-glucosidase